MFCSASLQHVFGGALVDQRLPNLRINQAMVFTDNWTPVHMAMLLEFIEMFLNEIYSSFFFFSCISEVFQVVVALFNLQITRHWLIDVIS